MTRKMKWLITGLCVSVGLNLLVLGFLGARMIYDPPVAYSMARMMDRLSPESRDILKDAFKENKDVLGDQLKAVHQSHKRIAKLLGAEELDDPALQDAFASLRTQSVNCRKACSR